MTEDLKRALVAQYLNDMNNACGLEHIVMRLYERGRKDGREELESELKELRFRIAGLEK